MRIKCLYCPQIFVKRKKMPKNTRIKILNYILKVQVIKYGCITVKNINAMNYMNFFIIYLHIKYYFFCFIIHTHFLVGVSLLKVTLKQNKKIKICTHMKCVFQY